MVEGGPTYWLSWDRIGRPVIATDLTETVVWAASYLPFGGIREISVDSGVLGQDLRFPGQWFKAETGLHQDWHRDYDPTTGRYLQADPLGLVDGPSVYGYARQNPVRFVDPTGQLIPLAPFVACLGGAVVGAARANAGFQFGMIAAIAMSPLRTHIQRPVNLSVIS